MVITERNTYIYTVRYFRNPRDVTYIIFLSTSRQRQRSAMKKPALKRPAAAKVKKASKAKAKARTLGFGHAAQVV